MKTTFILALLTAFLTVSTASFASNCGVIASGDRVENPVTPKPKVPATSKKETVDEVP